jgi:hypothetical protein
MCDDVDERIDATARDLTEGTPSPAVRAGIARQIATQRVAWRFPVWGAVAAAVSLIVVGVIFWPEPVREPVTPERAVLTEPNEPASAVAAGRLPPEPAPERPREMARPIAATYVQTAPTSEPVIVEALDVGPLESPSLEVRALEVAPVPLDELIVTPLPQ